MSKLGIDIILQLSDRLRFNWSNTSSRITSSMDASNSPVSPSDGLLISGQPLFPLIDLRPQSAWPWDVRPSVLLQVLSARASTILVRSPPASLPELDPMSSHGDPPLEGRVCSESICGRTRETP